MAVVGCSHGELDAIYNCISHIESDYHFPIHLLLICGDFQSMRNQSDLTVMACPDKYRDIRTFYKYYSGEKTAKVLTIYVGGNHEASNYHAELYV